jgi:hypothetical protein
MVHVPAVCLRYLHYRLAFSKNIDIGIDIGIFGELEKQMAAWRRTTSTDLTCYFSKGQLGLVAIVPKAIIYLEYVPFLPILNNNYF